MSPDQPQEPAPDLDPALGIDALRDAVALVKAMANGDREGVNVIANHAGHPRLAFAALASLVAAMLLGCGLEGDELSAVLDEASRRAADGMFDLRRLHPAPSARPGG